MSFNPHVSKMEWLNTFHEEPQYIIFTTRHIPCQQRVCTFTPYARFKVDRLTVTPNQQKTAPHLDSCAALPAPDSAFSKWRWLQCAVFTSPQNVSYLGNEFCDRISGILDVFCFYTPGNVHCDIDVKCFVFWNFSLPLYVIWTEGRKNAVSITSNLLLFTSSIQSAVIKFLYCL